jgi:retron-type reverse transcriptase
MKHTEITSVKQLANYLRCKKEFLDKAINHEYNVVEAPSTPGYEYDIINIHKFHIPKKGSHGGYRTVHAVYTFQLEGVLKILNNYLSDLYEPRTSVHGFVSGRNTKTNAKEHLAKHTVLSVDIDSFFDTITQKMVQKGIESLGFNSNVADWISKITTVNGHLVQGFNTSPSIANIVVSQLDEDLEKLAGESVAYTRYADDLYFSSNGDLPEIEEIRSIIEKHGFKLNDCKTATMKRGRNQYVTGLTVFDDKTPRIPKRIKRNLRLEIHKISQHGYTKHAIRRMKNRVESLDGDEFGNDIGEEIIEIQHRLFGWIHYIGSIEPVLAYNLLVKLKNAKR